jgi:hypothetical protein
MGQETGLLSLMQEALWIFKFQREVVINFCAQNSTEMGEKRSRPTYNYS